MTIRIEPRDPGAPHPRLLVVTLTCDRPNCPRQDQITTESYTDARSDLTKRGWVERSSGAFNCPQCAGRERRPDLFAEVTRG